MKKFLVMCLYIFDIYGMRNPFLVQKHSYFYTAYGIIHSTDGLVGIVWIDGTSYCVRQNECVVGHVVTALSTEHVIIQDEQGTTWKITKNPST